MLHLFEKNIENHFPDVLEKKMLVAASGGIDSMVLADLLIKSKQNIALAHVNFKLRAGDSDAYQTFVKDYALKKNIPFITKEFETKTFAESNKLSIREAARKLRYDWFDELIKIHHFDYLLTAHHLVDSLETFLIYLSRGNGIDGLLGIPERNEKIVRPLLPFSKEEIVQYAQAENLTWREDASNQSDAYLRNRIRHHVVPELEKLNEDFLGNFQKTLKRLQSSADFIKNQIENFKKNSFHLTKNGIEIPTEALLAYKPEESFLFELFKTYHFTDWKTLKELLNAQSGKQLFSATHRLIKDRSKLILKEELDNESVEDEFFIEKNNTEITHPIHLKISDADTIQKGSNYEIYLDKNSLKFPLILRKWQQGNYFYPSGMDGKKKVSKWFKDEKIHLPEKQNTWILSSENQIVYLVGKRADRRFLADEKTENIIRITYQPS